MDCNGLKNEPVVAEARGREKLKIMALEIYILLLMKFEEYLF
jgi:hypothetical protein